MPVNRTLGLTEKAREFSTTTDLLMTLALGFRVLDGSLWLGPGLCNKGLGGGGAWREVTCRLLQVSPQHSAGLDDGLDDSAGWMPWEQCGCCWTCPGTERQVFKGHTRSRLSFLPILQVKCSSRGQNSKKEASVALAATEGDGSMYLQVESPPPLKTPYFSFFPNLAVPFP